MPPEPLLVVRDLSIDLLPARHHGRTAPRSILRVSFQLPEATIAGLCGDSGSGKTTLALALTNLLPPEKYRVSGQILLAGRDLLAMQEAALQKVRGAEIATVFQDPLLALNPVLRIRRQITEILRAHRVPGDPAELLALAGLQTPARILNSYPHELSGGERQRVTIAQALSCRPKLIVADEPFTALDAPRVVELAALFRRLRDQLHTSFLIVSHHPGTLALTTDYTLVLSQGRLHEGEVRAR